MWHLLSMLFLGFQMESENCVWRFLLLFSAYCFCCEWIFCFFFKKSFAKLEFNLFIVDQGSCWVEWNCNFIDHECVCAFVNLSIFFCCCVGSLSLSVFSYSSIRNACLQLSTGQTMDSLVLLFAILRFVPFTCFHFSFYIVHHTHTQTLCPPLFVCYFGCWWWWTRCHWHTQFDLLVEQRWSHC